MEGVNQAIGWGAAEVAGSGSLSCILEEASKFANGWLTAAATATADAISVTVRYGTRLIRCKVGAIKADAFRADAAV